MGITGKVLVLVVLFCILHTSDTWPGRRRRRWFRVRVPWIRKVGNFFVRVGKVIKKGFDILTKGCCGLHPSYCKNREEFKRIQAQVKAKSALIDKDWIYVKKKLAQIKSVNNNNQIIFRNVRRVTLASTLTVETLDPKIIAKMNTVANELKKAIIDKNRTVLNYNIDSIGKEFEKTEEKSKTALLDASGIGGFGMTEGFLKMSADMFKLVKLDGVAKFLTTEVGGFLTKVKSGISKLFGFNFLEKLASTNKAAKIAMGVINFFNKYLNVFNNVFKIFELFGKLVAWITDLATCNKRKKEMEVNLRDLKKKQIEINDSYNKLQINKNTVNTNWAVVFGQATNEGLLGNLNEVEKIAEHSSSSSPKMRDAVLKVRNYRINIAASTPDGAIRLQAALITAVQNITFNSECYQRKLATLTYVSTQCKLGKSSFDLLYKEAIEQFKTNSDECRTESGLPYTTKAVVRTFVNNKAEKENFEKNCLLNSGMKRAVVCEQLRSGYTLSQAGTSANVDLPTSEIYAQSCPIQELKPSEIESICLMKKYKSQNEIKDAFHTSEERMVLVELAKCA